MPDPSLSAAIKEAYASAGVADVIHHTIEMRHSTFVEPIRVVRDDADLDATLEADAPLNAGEEVTFLGFGFDLMPPDVTLSGSPQLGIEIDNTTREIVAAVEGAMSSTNLIDVTYRSFLSSDLTAPQNDPPLTLTISKINANPLRVSAVAGFDDMTNKRFPAEEYTADAFPGLIAQ